MLGLFRRFNQRQILTLIVFSIADFCQAICVSLQAPFFPQEAEKKGCTATEYGLVFGIFELTVFIVSPFLGKHINDLGAKKIFNLGIFTTGSCSIMFGFLDKLENGTAFIGFSFVIRVIEAIGNSAFLTASFSIIAKEFPENVATMFACLETFFGLGLIVGPSVGGALYAVGGFPAPFISMGACLLSAACFTFFVLPKHYDEADKNAVSSKGVLAALKVPSISMAAYSILCASASVGFLVTALEPQLRQFNLSPVSMGLMFVVNGGSYALSAPMFGVLCDKWAQPTIINFFGAWAILIGFLFLGPAPFFPMQTIFGVCIVSLILHGIGIGAMLVSSFATAHREAVANGFPDNLDTYGLISGLWTSTFALGAFVGPSVAGLLMDHFGIRNATMFIAAFAMSVIIFTVIFTVFKKVIGFDKRVEGYEEIGGVTDYGSRSNIYVSERSDDPEGGRSPSIGYDSGSSGEPTSSHDSNDDEAILNNSDDLGHRPEVRRQPSMDAPLPTRLAVDHGHPLSPRSPFQCGSTGMFGGIIGFSVPIQYHAPPDGCEPHEIHAADAETPLLPPPVPTRNATVNKRERKRSRKNSQSVN